MKTNFTPQDYMDFLYGLMEPARRAEFEQAMQDNPELREEMDRLYETSYRLGQVGQTSAPALNPNQIRIMAQNSIWLQSAQVVKYAAAILVLFMAVGSLSNLDLRYDADGFSLSMSLIPAPVINQVADTARDADMPASSHIPPENYVTVETLREFQSQNAVMFTRILARERAEQQSQLREIFTDYATMIENRRMIDLELIQFELDKIQEANNTRLYQTDQVLYTLIEALSYRD